jgi:hypothetical protein
LSAFTIANLVPSSVNIALLSDLDLARARWPELADEDRVRHLADETHHELGLEPPIDPKIVASYRGISRIEEVQLPWAGHLTYEAGEVVARVRSTDGYRRKRFTAFHEIEHTYLPGFGVSAQFRCDPEPCPGGRGKQSPTIEPLADLGASELLMPRRHFASDLAGNDLTIDLVERLSDRYEASLEATGLRAVRLADRDAMLICLQPGVKPSEPSAEPVLRVRWSASAGQWPFVPRCKSAPPNSPFDRAMEGEIVDEITTIEGLTRSALSNVRVSTRLVPYSGRDDTIRLRVLALLSRRRRSIDAR